MLKQVNQFGGLQMESGATLNNCDGRATIYLKSEEYSRAYQHRKVWREGLEVAMKVKGSQGHQRVEWVLPEHPYTAISPKTEIHANHNEAHNSALRRRGTCLSAAAESLCQKS